MESAGNERDWKSADVEDKILNKGSGISRVMSLVGMVLQSHVPAHGTAEPLIIEEVNSVQIPTL